MHPSDPQTQLIDADDTLWENNIYFERAIADFTWPGRMKTVLCGVGFCGICPRAQTAWIVMSRGMVEA